MGGFPGISSAAGGASLDTSGGVRFVEPLTEAAPLMRWPDLSPFEQGYVEAMFAGLARGVLGSFAENLREGKCVGFSDLAPDTLAAIRADCVAFKLSRPAYGDDGALFWRHRNERLFGARFPPLTVTLGDDGTVRTSPVDGTAEPLSRSGKTQTPTPSLGTQAEQDR